MIDHMMKTAGVEGKFHYEILQGRISFIDPETKEPKKAITAES